MLKNFGLVTLVLSLGLTVASCSAKDHNDQMVIPVEVYGDLHDRLVEKETACKQAIHEKMQAIHEKATALLKLDGIWLQLRKLGIYDEDGLRKFVTNVYVARGFVVASMVFTIIAALSGVPASIVPAYVAVACNCVALDFLSGPKVAARRPVAHVVYY